MIIAIKKQLIPIFGWNIHFLYIILYIIYELICGSLPKLPLLKMTISKRWWTCPQNPINQSVGVHRWGISSIFQFSYVLPLLCPSDIFDLDLYYVFFQNGQRYFFVGKKPQIPIPRLLFTYHELYYLINKLATPTLAFLKKKDEDIYYKFSIYSKGKALASKITFHMASRHLSDVREGFWVIIIGSVWRGTVIIDFSINGFNGLFHKNG